MSKESLIKKVKENYRKKIEETDSAKYDYEALFKLTDKAYANWMDKERDTITLKDYLDTLKREN